MNYPDAVSEFARYVARPAEEIRLDEAALLLARTEYPALDLSAQLARLDALAARAECDPGQSPHANIANLNRLLFEEENFAGNEEEYDDPRNSYLNDVLDRKMGIPITLSLVYQEVARRCGLPVVGVGFPGHFLAKYLAASGEILLDPYQRRRHSEPSGLRGETESPIRGRGGVPAVVPRGLVHQADPDPHVE